jgi:Arc/MetJ-type ribon-helix-helix transcriptional regulator
LAVDYAPAMSTMNISLPDALKDFVDEQVVARIQAERDIDDAIGIYLRENAENAALGFIDAVEQAFSWDDARNSRLL